MIFSFVDTFGIRVPSLCFKPVPAWFLQTVLWEIYFLPLIPALIAFVSIRTMTAGFFIRVSDAAVFLDAFLTQDLYIRTIDRKSVV